LPRAPLDTHVLTITSIVSAKNISIYRYVFPEVHYIIEILDVQKETPPAVRRLPAAICIVGTEDYRRLTAAPVVASIDLDAIILRHTIAQARLVPPATPQHARVLSRERDISARRRGVVPAKPRCLVAALTLMCRDGTERQPGDQPEGQGTGGIVAAAMAMSGRGRNGRGGQKQGAGGKDNNLLEHEFLRAYYSEVQPRCW